MNLNISNIYYFPVHKLSHLSFLLKKLESCQPDVFVKLADPSADYYN